MALAETIIRVPEQMIAYLHPEAEQEQDEIQRNAMIMYPYIRKGTISHGRAAEILGMKKWDLIQLYDSLGFPYLSSVSDYEEDLHTVAELKELISC